MLHLIICDNQHNSQPDNHRQCFQTESGLVSAILATNTGEMNLTSLARAPLLISLRGLKDVCQ
jgi:hypothetical protein